MTSPTKPYSAAFIVPNGTTKVLSGDGWQFNSGDRLSDAIKHSLVNALSLTPIERYLGIESFAADGVKMSVLYDDQGSIEHIYFQLRGAAMSRLVQHFQSGALGKDCELFIPTANLPQAEP